MEHASNDEHTSGKVASASFFKLCTISIVMVFGLVFKVAHTVGFLSTAAT